MKIILITCFLVYSSILLKKIEKIEPPVMLKKINVPNELCTTIDNMEFGGDIRIGDLENNGSVAFIVYRAALSIDGGACQPSFLGAFTEDGNVLWTKGEGGSQPNRPGPVAIHDIDADGKTEVICMFAEKPATVEPYSMKNISL
ncbi:MAG: hypothetical protein R3182_09065, partial [Draconibacterium sp.]|nr:hypothetical protein [Draconibacterium sp.]